MRNWRVLLFISLVHSTNTDWLTHVQGASSHDWGRTKDKTTMPVPSFILWKQVRPKQLLIISDSDNIEKDRTRYVKGDLRWR